MNRELIEQANTRLEEIRKESSKLMNITSQLESLELISDIKNKRIYISDENMKKPIDIAAVLDCQEDIKSITDCIAEIIRKRVNAYEKELKEMVMP